MLHHPLKWCYCIVLLLYMYIYCAVVYYVLFSTYENTVVNVWSKIFLDAAVFTTVIFCTVVLNTIVYYILFSNGLLYLIPVSYFFLFVHEPFVFTAPVFGGWHHPRVFLDRKDLCMDAPAGLISPDQPHTVWHHVTSAKPLTHWKRQVRVCCFKWAGRNL